MAMNFPEPYRMKTAEVTPDNCEKEPIHIPGCIQPHGVLLGIRPAGLIIVQVSDNSDLWLGKSPDELLWRAILSMRFHSFPLQIGGTNIQLRRLT